jgi:hypothetical protein
MPGLRSANCSTNPHGAGSAAGPVFGRDRALFHFAGDDLLHQREDRLLDELDQAFKHLGLAGEMAVQRRFAHRQAGSQRGGGDAVCTGLFQHGRQGLQDLLAALAWLGTFARTRGIGGNGHRLFGFGGRANHFRH